MIARILPDRINGVWPAALLIGAVCTLWPGLPSSAAVIPERFSYDGSYLPNSASPPAGQTTWSQYVGSGCSIASNSPNGGVATLADPLTSQRVAYNKTFSDAGFIANPGNHEWEYSTRLRIDANSGTSGNNYFGTRDEGGNGRTVMLGWDRSNGSLFFANNTFGVFASISPANFVDGQYHEYRVRKYVDPGDGQTKVRAVVDGANQGAPILYSAFPSDVGAGSGFGYFSSTPMTSTFIFDEVRLGAAHLPLNAYQQAVLSSTPLAYYPFEEASPVNLSSVADASGGFHDGTYHNGAAQPRAQGPHGIGDGTLPNAKAPDFRASTDHVMATTLGNLGSLAGDGFTLEFWVNSTDTSSVQQAFGRLNSGTSMAVAVDMNRNSALGYSAGSTNFYLRATDGKSLSGNITANIYDGKWHHVAWAVNDPANNDMQVFVDGQLQNFAGLQGNSPASFVDFNGSLGIGAMNNRSSGATNHFNGLLDEVAIFNRPLSQAQLQQHLDALPEYLFSYDGTYAPNDTAPPLTQTTWNVVTPAYITENNKQGTSTVGFARFNDNGSARTSIFDTFDNDVSGDSWIYETRLAFDLLASNLVYLGVRDEGGSGKAVMLGWNPTNGSLGFHANNGTLHQSISSSNFVDGVFHAYRVEKMANGSDFDVQVYIDDVAQFLTPLSYNAFPNDDGSGDGLGYFGSSPGTSDMTMDYFSMQVVPEPGALALLLLGGLGLIGWRRRRGK